MQTVFKFIGGSRAQSFKVRQLTTFGCPQSPVAFDRGVGTGREKCLATGAQSNRHGYRLKLIKQRISAPDATFFGPVAQFAAIVTQLQENRHEADYSPRFSTTPDETRIIISTARDAITLFQSASDTQRLTFLTLLLFNLKKS
jgi:hypothetical protein